MRAHRHDLDAGGGAQLGCDTGPQGAERLAGGHDGCEHGCREPEPLDELVVPLARLDAEEPGRRRVRALGHLGAGELEADEVGHEQERVGEVEASARLLGGELVHAC